MLLREFFEAAGNEVAIIFGRFNPPHGGHRNAWAAAATSPVWYVGTNKDTAGPKDPLPFNVKIKCMEAIYPEIKGHLVAEQSWFTTASMVYEKHRPSVLYICTDDVDQKWIVPGIIKYNGKEGDHGYYYFPSIEWRKTERTAHATKLRNAVMLGNREAFSKEAGISADLEIDGTPFFDLVAKYLLPYADTKSGKSSNASAKLTPVKKNMTVKEGDGQRLSIEQLAHISDEALDNAYHYGRSSPGNTFGWQANLKSAEFAKRVIDSGETDIEIIADAIHDGWNETARAFVQNPGQFDDTEKLIAAGKLDAKIAQREKLMNISYNKLPDDEQEKDRVVAKALLAVLKPVNESMMPKKNFAGSNKNKLGPAAHLTGKMKRPARAGDLVGGAMEESIELDEVAAFHGSFRPRIGKFNFFSHFGSEQAAKERLDYLTAGDPRFKGITTGYLYKLDLGINNPATVKDHVDQQDPSTGNMIKIASWINDLKKDPRVTGYQYQKNERPLAWFANNAKSGYWREWMRPEAFIGEFINLLEKMGIDGFVYKNAVEHKGELSYISFRPENVKIVGRAKPVPLTPPEGVERKEKFTKPDLPFPTQKPKPGEQIFYMMVKGEVFDEISAKDVNGVKAEIRDMRSWGLDIPQGYKIVPAPIDPNPTPAAAPAKKKVKEGVIDEVADQPYRYMLTKKLPDARQYMFQTDSGTKFQVFFSLLDSGTETIADVGFADQTDKDNPTIGVTGKGDAFRVFSTVGAIVKEYVNSVKPDFLSFNGKTQDPGRIKLYDMIAKNITRYLKDYEQSSHTMPGANDEKGYMLQRITKPVDEVAKVKLSSDPNNFGAWVNDSGKPEKTIMIPINKLSGFEPDSKFDEPSHAKNLANIVKAIKAGKELPPILVRRHGIDRFQVLDGHHRFMAYRMAGAKSIPARVIDPKNVTGDVEEGWKSKLAGAAMVGLGALGGAGNAQADDGRAIPGEPTARAMARMNALPNDQAKADFLHKYMKSALDQGGFTNGKFAKLAKPSGNNRGPR